MSKLLSEECLNIDEHHLDRECLSLPSLIMQAASLAAEKKRDVEELKSELDVVEAELGRKVRDTPGKYGLEKVTETAVKEVVAGQLAHQEACRNIRNSVHQSNLATALLTALEAKKRSLTLLVDLHGMGYFASPRVSNKGRDVVRDKSQRDVYERQREKLRERDSD